MTVQTRSFPRPPVTVEVLPAVARFSLRLRPVDRDAAAVALGLDLPERIGQVGTAGACRALCLGPDEWQIDAPESEAPRIGIALAGVVPHALVEISDREVSFAIEGPGAPDLLAIGIARDLVRLAVGRSARTVFDGVQAVLVREGEARFTLSVWRSFAPHVEELLHRGARELALEP